MRLLINSEENYKEAKHVIETRRHKLEWYVLHYDVKTTEYLNEIEFKFYEDALKEFNNAIPINDDDRIELIYSPLDGDYEDDLNISGFNIVIDYITATEYNLIDGLENKLHACEIDSIREEYGEETANGYAAAIEGAIITIKKILGLD